MGDVVVVVLLLLFWGKVVVKGFVVVYISDLKIRLVSKHFFCCSCCFGGGEMVEVELKTPDIIDVEFDNEAAQKMLMQFWDLLCIYLVSGPLPGFQSPPGWHYIFRIGDPELNLHFPLESWEGGHSRGLIASSFGSFQKWENPMLLEEEAKMATYLSKMFGSSDMIHKLLKKETHDILRGSPDHLFVHQSWMILRKWSVCFLKVLKCRNIHPFEELGE